MKLYVDNCITCKNPLQATGRIKESSRGVIVYCTICSCEYLVVPGPTAGAFYLEPIKPGNSAFEVPEEAPAPQEATAPIKRRTKKKKPMSDLEPGEKKEANAITWEEADDIKFTIQVSKSPDHLIRTFRG